MVTRIRDLEIGDRFMLVRNGQKHTLTDIKKIKNRVGYYVDTDTFCGYHHSCHVKKILTCKE